MDKKQKKKIVISSALILLLIGSKITVEKELSSLNERVISWGSTAVADDVQFVAHRGYSSMYPDNSLEGLLACTDLKCIEGIECDVRLTKDAKLVLIHNEFIGFKHVYDFTYEELCEMDLSSSLKTRRKLFGRRQPLQASRRLRPRNRGARRCDLRQHRRRFRPGQDMA